MFNKVSNIDSNNDSISGIKVLTAENYSLSAKYLKIVLTRNNDFKYLGNASTIVEVKHYLLNSNADILLLDTNLVDFDMVETMTFLNETYPMLKVIIYADFNYDYAGLTNLIKMGACGYISRDSDFNQVIDAINIAHSGSTSFETQLGSNIKTKVLESFFHKH